MRLRLIAIAAAKTALVSVVFSSAAFAACPGGSNCDQATQPTEPVVVYPLPPRILSIPPTGYVLDPADARPDLYIVNQGPVFDGPDVTWFAAPTYSEGGYAFDHPYPYVYPYDRHLRSYDRDGSAQRRRYSAYGDRPFGYPPFGAYRYVAPPNARIIEIAP